ncbi:alpha/beta hydrolase [Pedosphaera parvula]|nr:alpha/beta hydrolase [Pedosphaera parvula]
MSLLSSFMLLSASQAQPTNSFPLWEDGAPGALGTADKDIPTLTPFFPSPDKATGAAMVVCPGGGYGNLAPYEGKDYALWLKDQGVTAFVLKYRLGSAGYHHPVELQDVSRAIRLVRSHAAEWKLDPKRVGIIGSSAGGHLAATLMTHFDGGKSDSTDAVEKESSRPDLGILCYPVITMGEKTHAGSKMNLLGKDPSPELVKELSNECHVTKETPPCFLFHTVEDKAVPVENALMFATALREAGVPFDLHIYEKGAHGTALGTRAYNSATKLHPWTSDCVYWLKLRGFVK